tara:strand:+ start:189 stop:461 length:273 start_codon:yes stop_codon:yes gene_type:complete
MPIWLAKIVVTRIFKVIKRKREWRKIDEYVNKPNILDKQFKSLQKTVNKNAKYIEELEKDVAILKKDSHPIKEFVCLECGCKAKSKNKES